MIVFIQSSYFCAVKNGAFFFLMFSWSAWSQSITGISGTITDRSGAKIQGAHVIIFPDSSLIQMTNQNGQFDFHNVKEGRKILQVSMTGYQTHQEELLVISGKKIFLTIQLDDKTEMLDQVEIVSGQPLNTPGQYAISIEKTTRMPGNFFDPVRMASVLPGIAASNDQTNGIIYRGYSPNSLLWRLNKLDVVNPNHLSNAGTLSDRPVANGGGVSILSSQVLDKTTFQSGIFDPSTGNALSGAVDMKFRKGNPERQEHTIQVGLIGLDLATEGPISKSGKSSYLINYRYSTVGLLTAAGLDFGGERINFNDLTFNIQTEQKRGGNISVFGFSGISSNKFNPKPEPEWETEKDRYKIDFSGKTFGLGIQEELLLGSKTVLQTGMAFSGQYQSRDALGKTVPVSNLKHQEFSSDRSVFSIHSSLRIKHSKNITSESGIVATSQWNELMVKNENTFGDVVNGIDGKVNGWLIQPYSGWIVNLRSLNIQPSVRYVHFTFNNKRIIEPRITLSLPILKGILTAGYGHTSQLQQIQWYLSEGGSDLPMTQSKQWYAEYLKAFASGLSWRIQGFYHILNHVPSSAWNGLPFAAIPLSTMNLQEELITNSLVSNGRGKNQGVEMMIEKRFEHQFYFLASGSVYNAQFGVEGSDEWWTARFNGRFTTSAAAGKEWQRSKNAFSLHAKVLSFGGQNERWIDQDASAEAGYTVYDALSTYGVRIPDYFRADLRASWRRNKPGRTRTVSIDIQNVTNRENIAGYYFDTYLQKVTTRKQLGIIPVITWRVEF